MGTEHYLIIMYQSSPGANKRMAQADAIITRQLANFFQFGSVTRNTPHANFTIFAASKKNYRRAELLTMVDSLPWIDPQTVQILEKSEHDDAYKLLKFKKPKGYEPGSTWAGSGDVALIERLKKSK